MHLSAHSRQGQAPNQDLWVGLVSPDPAPTALTFPPARWAWAWATWSCPRSTTSCQWNIRSRPRWN